MKTIEYDHRQEERQSWGEGPWRDEVDKKQWVDDESGLPCLIVRGPSGVWCGYVGVPEGHPLFKVEYDDIGGGWGDLIEAAFTGGIRPKDVEVDVHGGLTFSGLCAPDDKEHGICHVVEPGENDRVWWLGFDCGHMNDVAPGTEAKLRELGHESSFDFESEDTPAYLRKTYKPQSYVTKETISLARPSTIPTCVAPKERGASTN